MLNPPNSISFLRAPLALLFIIESTTLRTVVIILAMLSDCVDGYLARRYHFTSRFGAILDPLMDKFFVYVVLSVLLFEQHILPWQVATMLSRDFFLLLFLSCSVCGYKQTYGPDAFPSRLKSLSAGERLPLQHSFAY